MIHGRTLEETVLDLPPVVPTGPTSPRSWRTKVAVAVDAQ